MADLSHHNGIDIQLTERAINELKLLSNMADDFSILSDLCSQSAHLGSSVYVNHLQSLICSYVDTAVAMDAVIETIKAEHPDLNLELVIDFSEEESSDGC